MIMAIILKEIYRLNAVPIKIPMSLFVEKSILNSYVTIKDPTYQKQRKQCWSKENNTRLQIIL
jgi:hypothetical protein